MLEIAFRADHGSPMPVARQLTEHLASLIRSGRLPPGGKLPATREAAIALAVARNTVSAAYAALGTRGLVTAHVGQGTFVSAGVADSASAPIAFSGTAPREFAWEGLFAHVAPPARLPEELRCSERGGPFPFDFRGGRVAVDLLPLRDLRWAFTRPFESRTRLRALAAPLDPFGWAPLRRAVASHLAGRGIACEPEEVAIVAGIQQAIDLAARVLVDPGDAVVMEQPGYFGAALAFAGRRADLIGVDVDDEGLRTDRLARVLRLRRAKLIYVTPATQSPTGAAMSPARRDALMALANEYQAPILEDDYDSDLRYAGSTLPALKARDPAGQVIYAGTFSKVLFPSLRVGYVVAARPLLQRMVTARLLGDFGTGAVEQAALVTLLATRGLDRHLRRVRRLYAERLAAMLAALRREMPDGTTVTEPRSGHVVWIRLPPGIDPDRLHPAARARGVAYTRGQVFFFDGRGSDHLALAFPALDTGAIDEGITRLGAVARALAASRTGTRAGSRPASARVAGARRGEGRSVDGTR